jgi:hypothetical protein
VGLPTRTGCVNAPVRIPRPEPAAAR